MKVRKRLKNALEAASMEPKPIWFTAYASKKFKEGYVVGSEFSKYNSEQRVRPAFETYWRFNLKKRTWTKRNHIWPHDLVVFTVRSMLDDYGPFDDLATAKKAVELYFS